MTITRATFLGGLLTVVGAPFLVAWQSPRVPSFTMAGHSMDPTLHNGQIISYDLASYRHSRPRRGDIIVFTTPFDTTRTGIKRVIGLPGETVLVHRGTIFINDRPLSEPYIPAAYRAAYEMPAVTVPPHVLFVLGDNRKHSFDSHSWGQTYPLQEKLVLGRARLRR